MRADDEIQVVSITDNHYVQHLGVAYSSLLANKAPQRRICLHVIHDELTRVNEMRLELIAEQYSAGILFHRMDGMMDRHADNSSPVIRAGDFKITIPAHPSMLSVRKAIYLDCDIIVTGDIGELWDTDLAGRMIGAVADLGGKARRKDLNLPAGWPYFNAGVLLIDMEQWRAQRITEKTAQFMRHYPDKLIFHEQDALNSLLQAQWLELTPQWNWQTYRMSKKQLAAGLPGIIHYTGASKPWHYDNDHPYQEEYYKYLQMTGWRSYEPEKTRAVVMRRFRKRLKTRFMSASAFTWLNKIKSVLTDKQSL